MFVEAVVEVNPTQRIVFGEDNTDAIKAVLVRNNGSVICPCCRIVCRCRFTVKVTCKPTQRSYIGKTRSTQQQRWYQHCSDAKRGSDIVLHRAIREHGREAFEVETLQEWEDISNEALNAAEAHFIRAYNTFHEGYNRQVEGESSLLPVPIEQQAERQERLESEVKRLMSVSLSANTQRAYRQALKGLEQYLNGRRLTDGELAAYVTHLYDTGKSPSTITIVVAAVKWGLKKSDTSSHLPITDTVLAGIRREGKDRGRGQVDGLDWQAVERVCAFAESEKTLAGLRDAAMIRLMSDCLLRISEVVAVDVADFEKNTLIVRQSKTDQEGAETALYVTADTRRVVKRYLKKAEIVEGAVFRRIRRRGHVGQERLTDFSVRRIIQERAKAAGVDGFIAGHSLRVGSAVSLAQAGATVVDMQIAARWKSSQMPAHYAKAELAERGAIARFKEGKR